MHSLNRANYSRSPIVLALVMSALAGCGLSPDIRAHADSGQIGTVIDRQMVGATSGHRAHSFGQSAKEKSVSTEPFPSTALIALYEYRLALESGATVTVRARDDRHVKGACVRLFVPQENAEARLQGATGCK
jgi:hypothetical protein